jgi:hypothetical protein
MENQLAVFRNKQNQTKEQRTANLLFKKLWLTKVSEHFVLRVGFCATTGFMFSNAPPFQLPKPLCAIIFLLHCNYASLPG